MLFISDPLRKVYLQSRLFKMVTDKVKEPKKTTPLQSEAPGSRQNAHKFFTCNCFKWNSIHFNVWHR